MATASMTTLTLRETSVTIRHIKDLFFTHTQAKLRQHIHNPNAAELVHYLFAPLSLLIRCTGG